MKTYCPVCDQIVNAEVKKIEETYTIKGEKFTQLNNVVVCNKCGEKIFHEEYDDDNLERLYNQYRKKYDLMLPKEIKALRKRYKVSQKTFAQILGFGEVTITRYENGMIQDRVHNNTLELIKDEGNFVKLVNNSTLSQKEKNKIISNLACLHHYFKEDFSIGKKEISSFEFKDKYNTKELENDFNSKNFNGNIIVKELSSSSYSCEFDNSVRKEKVG